MKVAIREKPSQSFNHGLTSYTFKRGFVWCLSAQWWQRKFVHLSHYRALDSIASSRDCCAMRPTWAQHHVRAASPDSICKSQLFTTISRMVSINNTQLHTGINPSLTSKLYTFTLKHWVLVVWRRRRKPAAEIPSSVRERSEMVMVIDLGPFSNVGAEPSCRTCTIPTCLSWELVGENPVPARFPEREALVVRHWDVAAKFCRDLILRNILDETRVETGIDLISVSDPLRPRLSQSRKIGWDRDETKVYS
jgi:hypothetical protein